MRLLFTLYNFTLQKHLTSPFKVKNRFNPLILNRQNKNQTPHPGKDAVRNLCNYRFSTCAFFNKKHTDFTPSI